VENIEILAASLLGLVLCTFFADILIRVPGYFIYCIFFTNAEYDPDHEHQIDTGSKRVAAVGIVFWLILIGAGYALFRVL